ncbi:hypothetical protein ODJ79_06395 [Actinoplanes sp. KI2]|uniref:hypothetical protein n=1 Tax=Actinoplanes sp. KI2 TaxID=2983315 RepID=UPI0021D58C85|nr:hypothetical protein [Actinoplanes sp. KI2]MCU7723334.1 hypothetical protein [Actinoplanes sp. KI2]
MRGYTRARHVGGLVVATVLAITIGSLITSTDEPARVIPAGVAGPSPKPPDTLQQLLTKQAAALNRGDLTGWLARVAPPLRQRYQNLFRTLRALHATVDYRAGNAGRAVLTYCFSPKCPPNSPKIGQSVQTSGGKITALAMTPGPEPTPWQQGDLIFAQGRRVTVGAPKALKAKLPEVVELADEAARIDDRYAAYADNRQARYRIYLATDRTWRTWYGGKATEWAVGYMQPLGPAGADVVINPGRLPTRAALREVLQHELAHVATIGGVATRHEDMWLVEGVAEYIGMQPRRAADTYSKSALLLPTRLNPPPLRDGASAKEVAAFYAAGHFAVDCLVTQFGEPRAMEFARQRLRLGASLDDASRSAFGRPFGTVGKTCVNMIGHQFVTRES